MTRLPEDRPEKPVTGLSKTYATARAEHLARLCDMLAGTPQVRTELVDDIRRQLDAGTYLTEEKLDLAIYRMLKDILG